MTHQITQAELIAQAIQRARNLNPDFTSIEKAKLKKAAKVHVKTGKDCVDGIYFDLSHND